ncbi:MAG TPA: FG-GAP-like repeat-containing protein [Candidatus Limnocylindrales bacterium]|nr:FG-GAP-like repeat-containing protein [Candidatus Limnocylindrales bacterium]
MPRTSALLFFLLIGCSFLALAQSGQPSIAAVGDLNGDGKLDVVVANGSLNNVGVFLNDGSGGLTAGKFFAVAHPANSVQLADFNSDGHLDILVIEQVPAGTSPLEVMLGDGTGNFAAPVAVPLTSATLSAAVVADFNGDGKADIAFASITSNSSAAVGVMLGDGKGAFSAPVFSPIAYDGTFVINLTVVDSNKDGKPDLVVDTASNNPIRQDSFLSINDGTGAFLSMELARGNFEGNLTTAGDFNGDGNLDFLAGGEFLFGDGQGGILFSSSNLLTISTGTAVDLDHNGKTDLAVNGFSYRPGNGSGGFGDVINFATPPAGVGPRLIAVGDFNGDGVPDLVLLNSATNEVSVFLNNVAAPASIAASTLSTFVVSASTTSVGGPVTLVTQVIAPNGGGIPTGTVTFKEGATTLGSAPVNIYGNAALPTTFATGGLHSNLTGSFTGTLDPATNTLFGNSDTGSIQASISVNNTAPSAPAPTVTLSLARNPVFVLHTVIVSSSVTSTSGTPTGNVTYLADGDVIGVEPVGTALLARFPTAGLHNIQAVYGGDGTFPLATSATAVEDVRAFNTPRAPSTTQVTATPGPNGGGLNLNSQVSGGAIQPTGTILYRANGGFVAFQPPGQQVFFNAAPGTYQISATYQGDAALAPSSASVIAVVGGGGGGGDFSLSSSPQSATVKVGQSATFTITLSPQAGFASATNFACSGLPAGSACSFAPATLMPIGFPVSTTLTLTTTAAAATILLPNSLRTPGAPPTSSFSTVLLLLMLTITSWTLRKTHKRVRLPLTAALLLLSGCGGGAGTATHTGGTPQGTFQVTVTATSTSSHTLPLSITVTP